MWILFSQLDTTDGYLLSTFPSSLGKKVTMNGNHNVITCVILKAYIDYEMAGTALAL